MNIITSITTCALASGKRTIQALVFGKIPYGAAEYAPWGIDGCPVKGTNALYSETSNTDARVIWAYENGDQLAQPGELRIYATDAEGNEVGRIWLHTDGSIEIGGTGASGSNDNHLTQYEALNTAITNYLTALNEAITAGVGSAGGTYTAPPAIVLTPALTTKLKIQ